ncbi:ferritin-like domain-containing protein [Pholiota molesta]|nr:ferritin-like domain-containing protein [Pholiota molesta]
MSIPFIPFFSSSPCPSCFFGLARSHPLVFWLAPYFDLSFSTHSFKQAFPRSKTFFSNKNAFHSTFVALVSALPYLVSAAPARIYGRTVSASDILVYTFADVLEQLEAEFYTQALAKFQDSDFTSAGFSSSQLAIQQLTAIGADESTHSTVLQAALKSFGAKPVTSCKFNFDSALTDVATMAATARVVEAVGVGAYLGGATLLDDPVLLDSAASILTVEARHQTILNVLSSTGTAIPSAFDIALSPSEVLSLAGPFFSGACDLGVPANPALSLTNTDPLAQELSSLSRLLPSPKFFCQMLVGGSFASIPLPFDNCVVPSGINGPVAIFVTSDGQPLVNNVRDRATTQLVAGPTMAFIDTQPQMLGQLARGASAIVSSAGTASAAAASTTASSTGSASAASASSTASAGSSSSSASVLSSVPGGPNTFVGPAPNGSINVVGWSNLPSASASASPAAATSFNAADSGVAGY